ncbi:MAG: aminodeoxychorismate synthase component I [Planctomycetota bacterium]
MKPLELTRAGELAGSVARAVCSAPYGFVLDRPEGSGHARNLPFAWPFPLVAFGWEPREVLSAGEGETAGDPLSCVRAIQQRLESGGCAIAVGFLSYDLGGFIEPTAVSTRPPDPLPLVEFCLYDRFYTCDPGSGGLFVESREGRRPASKTDRDEILDRAGATETLPPGLTSRAGSNFTRGAYIRAVDRAREYILDGDIFEVNLSQRFQATFSGPAWELYLRLRRHNPAPYAALLTRPDAAILSSSPELFLRVDGDHVVTRPIKGTIARRARPADDSAAAAALEASEKDNAELAMIIDLERNDLGRVCRYGSVRVRERARVATFARVHHLVSTVEGKLERGVAFADLIAATFPGGSITGAPKVRAMQIIDELEPCRRGVYTGSIGCLLPGGRTELNIAIRTMVYRRGTVWSQVGGAVTADSEPAAEYDETVTKALAMFEALGIERTVGAGGFRDE